MPFPTDYIERVYAGVLGKLIGVYLGRPFEGWTYERIMAELGEIRYYVHERLNVPLIVTDDDIAGTFTFLWALPDHGNTRNLTPAQIGQTWLNYLIEERTVLWWGGMGNSTEHTAYLRLKRGIAAPRSGSADLNGTLVSEQIGAQIFIDGWAMVAPGDPELAADLARRAASVSHDGEAIYGAQVIAAMEAQAFVERDSQVLLDTALRCIPSTSLIARLIGDVRAWHTHDGDWRITRERIVQRYGYDTYGGNCHIIPNHALIILALLYGNDDFQQSLMIVNTCGWDTDCNAGNLGCLLGIKNGLAGLAGGPDWRGPIADRLYLPTADGGRCITDAVRETYQIANIGRALAGKPPIAPKGGARFHFTLLGSVQGFQPDVASRERLALENVAGHSVENTRSLALRYTGLRAGGPVRAFTPTFIPPDAPAMPGYELLVSPTLYPGQTVRARVAADAANRSPVLARLALHVYGAEDRLAAVYGPEATLEPDGDHTIAWRIPEMHGAPIAAIGIEIEAQTTAAQSGAVYLDYLTWDGAPDMRFGPPAHGGTAWQRAWVNAADLFKPDRIIQNEGAGLVIIGTREWSDYRVSARLAPHMVEAAGIAARVQGMRRYYALLLVRGGSARLVKMRDGETTLAETQIGWQFGATYALALEANGTRLRAWIDNRPVFDVTDSGNVLSGGGVALVCTEGRLGWSDVEVRPIDT